MQEDIRIDFVPRDRESEQVALFNEVFGQNFTLEKWNEKHYNNPYVKEADNINIGIFHGDKLIGFSLFMPQEYVINGKRQLIVLPCENAVDKNYRGHGYLQQLLKKSEDMLKDKYDYYMGLPNENSRRTDEKLGFKLVYNLDILITKGTMKNLLRDGMLGFVMHRNCKLNTNNIDDVICSVYKDSNIVIEKEFNIDIKNLNLSERTVEIYKGKQFYDWKFKNYNDENRAVRYIYYKENNEIKSYCIVKFNFKGRLSSAEILDIYIDKNSFEKCKLIIKGIKKICSIIKIITPSYGEHKELLSKMGFFVYKKNIYCLMYKCISDKKNELDIAENGGQGWQYTAIESDTILN